MKCLVDTNLCQRLLYQMIDDQRKRNIQVYEDYIDGAFLDWTDLEGCVADGDFEEINCGRGYRRQSKTCQRNTGSPYCKYSGTDITGDVIYRTIDCQIECPVWSSVETCSENG